MADVIRRLPPSVANQIAAGEVVQRPASVVKELIENAVDAGATAIAVHIDEGGRGAIRVIDDGCGLSPTDARLAFERHATSKIARADDLFALASFGFRGEALPSIASVAEVELLTRRPDDETGIRLPVTGGTFGEPTEVNIRPGTQLVVKNLFYNIPARRKFLKSKAVETRHVADEFVRVALAHPEVGMSLHDDGTERWRLAPAGRRQRIVGLFGKHINASLLDLKVDTTLIRVEGFVGTPASAKKSGAAEQFLFVNGRYFRSPYLHKAVMNAYEKLIGREVTPPYFLYLTVDPARIDVNIHPTKTEIKFEDEQAIWQILAAAVRESLGKLGAVPLMDFEIEEPIDIPVLRPGGTQALRVPAASLNPDFNPFDEPRHARPARSYLRTMSYTPDGTPEGWDELQAGGYDTYDRASSEGDSFHQFILDRQAPGAIHAPEATAEQALIEIDGSLDAPPRWLPLSRRRVALARDGQLMVVDLSRAHERILYERFAARGEAAPVVNQQELFAEPVAVSPEELAALEEVRGELAAAGFDLRTEGEGVVLAGVPADLTGVPAAELVDALLAELRQGSAPSAESGLRRSARALARACAVRPASALQAEEIDEIILSLFRCSEPAFTADGRAVWAVFSADEIKKRLQ